MFRIYNNYQNTLGRINFSQALTYSEFKSRSKGFGLKYVQTGQENYIIDGIPAQLRKGQWMLIRDAANFQIFSQEKAQAVNGICVDLNTDQLIQAHEGFAQNDLLFNIPFYCGISTVNDEGLEFLGPNKLMSDQQGQEILQRMFKRLIEFAEDVQDLQSPLSSHAKNLQTQQQLLVKLLYARDFIHRHYTSNLKLKDIAHQSLLSKYHFHRLFRDCFQISPKDLQIQLRMKKAKELLAEYDLPIHSIAYQLGYVDTSAFSNQFKKYFHLTPLQYRTKL